MSKHTPGPWDVAPSVDTIGGDDGRKIWSEGSYLVAFAFDNNHLPCNAANAHLIAAAPRLLSAAKALLSVASVRIDDPRIAQFDALRAAVEKAEGSA